MGEEERKCGMCGYERERETWNMYGRNVWGGEERRLAKCGELGFGGGRGLDEGIGKDEEGMREGECARRENRGGRVGRMNGRSE